MTMPALPGPRFCPVSALGHALRARCRQVYALTRLGEAEKSAIQMWPEIAHDRAVWLELIEDGDEKVGDFPIKVLAGDPQHFRESQEHTELSGRLH